MLALFIVLAAPCVFWSLLYFTCAAHYFLTTIIDSSAGADEVHYPSEPFVDWWWKPLFCFWVLAVWLIPATVILAPLGALSPEAFAITLGVLLWLVYPLSLLSALYTQNWFFFLHPIILWRMLRHYGAFTYVHLLTLLSAAVPAGLLIAAFKHNLLWALPAAFVIPAAMLFYARHWGRFAWLSLNFQPYTPQRRRRPLAAPGDDEPEMPARDVDTASEGIREGLPSGYPHGIQASAPIEEDEWAANKKPYKLQGDDPQPAYQESASAAVSPTASAPAVEEEEEWAPNKKPYNVAADAPPVLAQAEADRPISLSKHYDKRWKKEQAAKRKAKEESALFAMPPPSKKTPTFQTALFFGVWEFMIYGRTLRVWLNLVLLTIVELFLLLLVARLFSA